MKYHHSSAHARKCPHDPQTRAQLGYRLRVCRMRLGWSIPDAAQNLQVTERTWHNWETGVHRIPFAVYKLARVLARYELPGGWSGYRIEGNDLITPEGRSINCHDASWWSLLVRRAHGFDAQYRESAKLAAQLRGAGAPEKPGGPRLRGVPGAEGAGLVTYKTSDTDDHGSCSQNDVIMTSWPTHSDCPKPWTRPPEPKPTIWVSPSMPSFASPWTLTFPVRVSLLPRPRPPHRLTSQGLPSPSSPAPHLGECPELSGASSHGYSASGAKGPEPHQKQVGGRS